MIPVLDPSLYGWTLEFCLLLWVWLVFWGNAFVVRPRDHVAFDILLNRARAPVRRWFVIVSSVAISVALILAVGPTWEKFHILRLKKTATLDAVFGDGVRMRGIYSIFIVFLVAVSLRYARTAYRAIRHDVDGPDMPDAGPARE